MSFDCGPGVSPPRSSSWRRCTCCGCVSGEREDTLSTIKVIEFRAGDPPQAEFDGVRGLADAAPEPLAPGTECLLLMQGDAARARASIGAAADLTGAPGVSGMIGHYEALDAEAGVALLQFARRKLADRRVARVLGPMNGSTWMRYRLALPREPADAAFEAPVFAGEPRNPDRYPADFEAAGFRVACDYESSIEKLEGEGGTVQIAPGDGIAIRCFEAGRFDAELAALHEVSLEGFRDNGYYSPLPLDAFRALYEPFRGRFDPGLVFIAEAAPDRPVGYLFTYPDPLSARDGRPTRVIIKTLAVTPAARGLRLGSRLIDLARAAAVARGYRTAIYALMRADNIATGMAQRRTARLFRRYALYEAAP